MNKNDIEEIIEGSSANGNIAVLDNKNGIETDVQLPLSNYTDTDIQGMIYQIHGQQVMLDFDLAKLYVYEFKKMNQQVKRNINRFPKDFMFQLTEEEMIE